MTASTSRESWFLEGLVAIGDPVWRTRVEPLPFRIGRRATEDLTLDSTLVSGRHAELFESDGSLWVRDLDSTNGTFRNGERVHGERAIELDDVLVFGDREFRLVAFATDQGFRTTRVLSSLDAQPWLSQAGELQEQLNRGEVEVHFQPVRSLESSGIVGYEVLGRGRLGGQRVGPAEMFAVASLLRSVPRLCHEYRRQGLADAADEAPDVSLLLNTHPEELEDPDTLLAGLSGLRREFPDRSIILEIHEAAASDTLELKTLGRELTALGIELAFDDFGTGRDRLVALAETSPRLLKFDIAMVRSLDQVSPRRRQMVERLVTMVRGLGISTVAEGIETEGELQACREVGFDLGQGFHLGRPSPIQDATWA